MNRFLLVPLLSLLFLPIQIGFSQEEQAEEVFEEIDITRLPTSGRDIDIRALQARQEDFRQKAVKRILEIDEEVEPELAKLAELHFKIGSDEYAFLRLQARSKNNAASFKKARDSVDYDEVLQALDYFDAAYEALQSEKYWVGQEESLISEDAALYELLQKELEVILAETEEGQKLIELIKEREELYKILSQPQPILDYLIERRRWWDNYPEYKKSLKIQQDEEIYQYLNN